WGGLDGSYETPLIRSGIGVSASTPRSAVVAASGRRPGSSGLAGECAAARSMNATATSTSTAIASTLGRPSPSSARCGSRSRSAMQGGRRADGRG
ncbi:MAG: hypothetical protein AVDCRST_MAG59-4979, partial [uncultured Thermomicrobiales bacterium]